MSFRNANATVQEARAQVQLPPDAVVSRVTLWVNGEEREAAFGSRGQVRQAYQRVVSARRDPLLVTTSGPGRVLVQCFPVPANGEMKIRIGITAPLYQRSQLLLPQFVERNFRVGEEHKHSIWMESTGPIQAAGLESAQDGSVFRLRGESAALPVIAVQAGEPNQVWARDERRTGWIGGRPIFVKGTKPRKVAVVVDASAGLAQHKDAIARALPPGVRVFAAGDDVVRSDSRLNGVEFHGGIDSVPALVEAHRSGADAIVWIHGLQPETFMPAGVLLQYRQRGNTPLYVVAAQSGPNRIAEALDALAIPVPGTGSLQRDLENLFRNWDGGWRWEFERRDAAPAGAPITSAHLGRLWAASEVRSLLAARRNDEAGQLAAQYQLVTPASGAVVLENQRQYDENNLKPADPLSVPTVPEPETWMLMALAAVLLMASRRRNLWPRHS